MILIAFLAVWLAWLLALPPRPSAWLVASSGIPLLVLGSWMAARRAAAAGPASPDAEGWLAFFRRTADVHALAAVLLIALGVQFEDTHGVTTDGVIYFSQLRSVIFDRDLDVAAEFAFLGQPARPYHVVPIGPTLVWLPLYLIVAGVDTLGAAAGLWAPSSSVEAGLTLPYVRAALVSSFAIGALGLFVLHRRLRQEFSPGVALAASVLTFAATPLVWYMVYEPSMTHAASFGFVVLFVVAAERWTSPAIPARPAMWLGALLGLAFITRPQEAVFALLPAVLMLTADAPWRTRLSASMRLGLWALLGVLPFLVLQAAHSTILLSRESVVLVGDDGYLDVLSSRWADTLWSSWHGFFSWTPVAYIAALGTLWYARRRLGWAVAALLILFVMAWVNGSTTDWAGGWSFGGRRFVSVLAALAPGLALVVHALVRRPMIPLAMIGVAAIAWHQMLNVQYARGWLEPGEATSFARIVRQQAALATGSPFVYPFAFPANAWFAWRTGLPASRYDLLGAESLRDAIDVRMTADAGKYLLDGWGVRVDDVFGALWWMDGSRAELVLPLDPPRHGAIVVELQARTRRIDPPSPATVAVSVNGREIGQFTPETDAATVARFEVPADGGILVRGFNRVVFEKGDESPPVGVYRIAVRGR